MYLGAQRVRGRPVGKMMRLLERWDALDAEGYRRLARLRLETMLAFASERVPLYRSGPWHTVLDSASSDIERWPVLDRRLLVERGDELVPEGVMRPLLFPRHSSASTGTAVEVLWSPEAVAWSWAAEYHPMRWHGIEIGARTLRMWGSARALENFVLNRHFVPAHDLTPARLEDAAGYIEARKPDLVWGTPSAVHELARYIGLTRSLCACPRVAFVKVGGEQLYSFQREEIARHLGGRLIESYGCTEMGPIASECPAGSLHVLTANVHVEIFRKDSPAPAGKYGEIVATTLVNRGMPLVRCRIGDLGALSPEPCVCGRPQPVLEQLQGRAADLVLKTDGTPIHGSWLGQALHRYSGRPPLGCAQKILFEQLGTQSWRVRVESHQQPDLVALERQVDELMREVVGPDCRTQTEIVANIAREPSGKFRYYKAALAESGAGDRPRLH